MKIFFSEILATSNTHMQNHGAPIHLDCDTFSFEQVVEGKGYSSFLEVIFAESGYLLKQNHLKGKVRFSSRV